VVFLRHCALYKFTSYLLTYHPYVYFLSMSFRLAVSMFPPVHRRITRMSSIQAVVLHSENNLFCISPSIAASTAQTLLLFQWQYFDNFLCLICANRPSLLSVVWIFPRIHSLVFGCVQLIRSILRIKCAIPTFQKLSRSSRRFSWVTKPG